MDLTPLILSGFKRVNNKVAPDLIGNDELTTLNDAVLDYNLYKPTKRGNFTKYDAGVTAGGSILRLSDVKNSSSEQRILAAAGTKIVAYNPTANTWADYIISLTSGFKFRMVPFSDKYIFTFDTDDDPVMASNDMSTYWNLQMPEVSNTDILAIQSFHDNGGNLTKWTVYKWIIVGMTEDGQLTPPSRPFTHIHASPDSYTTDDGTLSSKVYFKKLPFIADSKVVSRMIFRNKADFDYPYSGQSGKSGEIYYLATILDNDSTGTEYQTEWEDNLADDDLGTEIAIYLNTPTRSKYITFSNERLFLGNFSQKDRNFICPTAITNSTTTGKHTGADNASTLTDSNQSWANDELIGMVITNVTDGSSATITDNTSTTITATLGGGTQNDWDVGDIYRIAVSGWSGGYNITFIDTATGGALLASTQYDYRIHYEDKYGRRSRYYHQCGTTTTGGGDTHCLSIINIGGLDSEIVKECPIMSVYRRTGGTGNYYLIGRGSMETSYSNHYPLGAGGFFINYGGTSITDFGISNLTETWVDPDINIKSYPSAICFSEISQPSTMRDEDKRQIFQDDGQPITGLFDDTDGLVVFKSDSIGKMFLSGNPNNWSVYKFVETIGGESETIQKLGGQFYFIHKNKAYRWSVGQKMPENIGIFNQYTLDTIQTWYDSTINEEWYVLQGYDGSNYITLIYDLKIDAWYTFIRQQNAAEVFKTIYFTKNGTTQELLSNCDTYISIYNKLSPNSSSTRADTETGTTLQIAPDIKSKDIISPDGLTKARLRKLKFSYKKVTGQNTTIIIRDEDSGTSITLSDTTGSGAKVYETGIGRDVDSVKKVKRFSVNVTGYGMEEWENMRIETRPIKEGS